ncbi:FAD-binding oxidoreductase [Burkholderia gladioli]|uniref:FAD-binding oxidoreductase n=1 Tax=Burkholderia gladioli TaxID=28095 RepID=A0A2A7SB64_BURGA|nr:FAD-binding oxidoreductase [Burkholderia gladioli]MBU9426030.1 FAD-binding oxidoreductase [Burkholderia gladioli]MDN8063110.1 FAD-binding oxidoreductase [Burkholderia gladioli]PEH40732.1 FAD-binding oxidoreductase [Burkholderia gladioli]QPQ87689.1 FAD-binding oxidoreductase [Burkholderia gladioli]
MDAPVADRRIQAGALAAALADGSGQGWLDGEAGAPYLADLSHHAGRALGIARPASTEQARALVRAAVAQGVVLIPQGERSGLVGAAVPDRSGAQCVVALDRLRRIRSLDPVNRSITVEAGARLSEINRAAREHGLTLPIDLGSDPSAGGLVGANAGGSRLIKYGDVRRNVLGIEAVLADAQASVVDTLAPLRKRNAGFDPTALFVGAGGANGLITAVSFALAPLERSSYAGFVAFASYQAATRALLAFEQAFGELLSAFEFMSSGAVARVTEAFPQIGAPLPAEGAACFALFEVASAMPGLDALLETRALDTLDALSRDGIALDAACAASERFWKLRDALPLAVAADGLPLSFDVSFARGELAPFVDEAMGWLAEAHPDLHAYAFGHFGDGGCHLVVTIPPAQSARYGPMQQIALRGALYERVARLGGCFSAEHGVGPVNLAWYRKHVPAPLQALAGTVQRALDPLRLLGRVRY